MPDTDFEKAFATLAYAELEQKVPGLFPYLIGFQLVDKNEDDTQALGIFGFKVGDQWYYSPVFWLNGKVKGYDLLYIVSQDLFIPLRESWINYITNRKPYVMGESDDRSPAEIGASSPDFDIFRRSPLSKTSEEKTQLTTPEGMFKNVEHGDDLIETLQTKSAAYTHGLLKAMDGNVKFAEAVLKFYGPEKVAHLVRVVANQAQSKNIFKQASDEQEHFVSSDGSDKVNVLYGTTHEGIDTFKPQTTMQKEKMLSGQPVIEDYRDEKDKSEVYATTEYEQVFQNPARSGLWEILMRDGSLEKVIVGINPNKLARTKNSPFATIVTLEGGKFGNFDIKCVLGKNELAPDVWDKTYESKTKSLDSIAVGDYGVMVDKHFNVSIPFRVNEKLKGKNGDISLNVDVQQDICRRTKEQNDFNSEVPSLRDDSWISYGCSVAPADCGESDTCIKIVDGPARMTELRGSAMVGREKTRFMKLGTARKPVQNDGESYTRDPWCKTKRDSKIELGSLIDVDTKLRKLGMHKLAVEYDGDSEVTIKFREKSYTRMGAGTATGKLVEKTGMSEANAKKVLDTARTEKKAEFFVKQAIVSFEAPPTTYDEKFGAPVQYADSNRDVIESETVDSYEPYEPDEQTQQVAMQAADMGQKEVFDTSVMSGMAQHGDATEKVNELIKDIIVGNDRIGRTLFLYYMHFDKFAEKYGDEDLGELEDLLRESFERNGDVILFLKKKSVEPDAIATESVVAL